MLFKKKKPQAAPQGRTRPSTANELRSPVFSYHASRSPSPVPGVRDAGRVAAAPAKKYAVGGRLVRGTRLLVTLGLLGVLVLNLIIGTNPRIQPLHAEKDSGALFLHTEAEYKAAASDLLASSLLHRTKLTVDGKKLAAEMSKQFPELASVIVSTPFIGQQPVFYIEPATPKLLLGTADNEVYILDATGKAMASLKQVPEASKLHLPTVRDESGFSVKLGAVALPSTSVAFITEVAGQLKAKRLSVATMVMPEGTNELHVGIGGAGYIVKFNLHGDARAEVGAFLAVKQKLDRERIVPKSYIDVRVENRAYYL